VLSNVIKQVKEDEQDEVTEDMLKYVIEELMEDIDANWMSMKESSEFVDECVITMCKDFEGEISKNAIDPSEEDAHPIHQKNYIKNNHNNSVTDNTCSANRSHKPLAACNASIKDVNFASDSSNANRSNKKKAHFQGMPKYFSNQPKTVAKKSKVCFQRMPKYSPINNNTLGLRRSQRIDSMNKKVT